MDDLAGIGKVANSKVAEKIYDDAGSLAVRQLGGAAEDLVKTLRLFTAPFQLAALAQDRFKVWLDEVRSRVPLDKQVEAPPTISGPALRALLFMEKENALAQMFLNLLAQAINKDVQHKVHPGFVAVLEQMAPDEALLLHKLRQHGFLAANLLHVLDNKVATTKSLTSFPQDDFVDPDSLYMYFEHLVSLGLVRQEKDLKVEPEEAARKYSGYRWFCLSPFGSSFLAICGQQ